MEEKLEKLTVKLDKIMLKIGELEKRINDLEKSSFGTGVYLDGTPDYVKDYVTNINKKESGK